MRNSLGAGTFVSIIGRTALLGVVASSIGCSGDASRDADIASEGDGSALLESAVSTVAAPVKSVFFPVGPKEQIQKITYSVVDGLAIFEGDIVLGTAAEVEAFAAPAADGDLAPLGVAISGSSYRWPNKKVPYTIDSGLSNKARVTDAIAHWESKTSLDFVLRTSSNAGSYPNYVTFRSGSGCSASVGKRTGQQFVNLATSCSKGNAIHEIGHAIGLWHEQSREDRDNFVTIHFANITAGYEHNFNKHVSDGTDIGTYDYASIMHYPENAFSKNDQPTITTKNGADIGQRTGLSTKDVSSVGTMYP